MPRQAALPILNRDSGFFARDGLVHTKGNAWKEWSEHDGIGDDPGTMARLAARRI